MQKTIKRKKFPIYAGMQFTYPNTKNNKLQKVGHYIVQFTYDSPLCDMLIEQKEVKRVFY